jgi:beta-alanine--pyruvate transaminase
VACAAGIAALDVLVKENMVERVASIAPYFEQAVHSLKGTKHITDIRNIGLAAGFTFAAVPGEPLKRPYEVAMKCLEKGFYVRYGGDTIQLAPPFIIEKSEIDSLINALGEAINATE